MAPALVAGVGARLAGQLLSLGAAGVGRVLWLFDTAGHLARLSSAKRGLH